MDERQKQQEQQAPAPAPRDERTEVEARLLRTLERLLQLDATTVTETLNTAAQLVAEAIGAEKVDAFLHRPENQTLQVVGISSTPMSVRERALGLDRIALADGGRVAEVFQTGTPYETGHADRDPQVTRGVVNALGVRSLLIAPLEVGGKRRGALQVASAREEAFTAHDGAFIAAVSTWVGLLLRHAELVERLTTSAAETARRVAADDLITILAHDLRNLLTPIRVRLQLLQRRFRRQSRSVEGDEIGGALSSLARLNSLILNLLDTARLDHGLFAIEPQDTDLTALARETAALMSTSTVQTPIRIDASAAPSLFIQADPVRLRQVIENLVGNALQHSPSDAPVVISIKSERQTTSNGASDASGDWAVLVVENEGEGIPPELLSRLFDRYAKGTPSTGLGLGLYVSSQIVQAHGGTLTAESAPGQGARFTVRLPLVLDE